MWVVLVGRLRFPGTVAAVLVLAPFVTLLAAHAAAQDFPPEAVTTDPAGDVKLQATNTLPPQDATPTGQADGLDILKVTIGSETEKDFQVTLELKGPPAQGQFPQRLVQFDLDGVRYRVGLGLGRQGGGGGGGGGATANGGELQVYDDGVHRYRNVVNVQTDVQGGKAVFTLPRDKVVNKQHVPVRYGDMLMNVTASTFQRLATVPTPTGDPTGGAYMYDRAPDTGFGTMFMFSKGRVGSGALHLSVTDPIRVSNGEATTIVYKVDAMNHGGDREIEFQLEAKGTPPDWDVRLPGLLKVPANGMMTFPVILGLPFTHKHGETATFELRAQDVSDTNTWSSVNLGVWWTETPQPAGHHPTMWIHSAPSNAFGNDPANVGSTVFPVQSVWFNPLEQEVEEGVDDGNVPAFFNDDLTNTAFGSHQPPSGTDWQTNWFIPLSPALLIGLDLDTTQLGKLTTKVLHQVPAQQSKLVVDLMYCDPTKGGAPGNCSQTNGFGPDDHWSVIGHGESPTVSADQGETVGYEVPLTILPAGDYIPYQRGANIALRLVLHTSVPENTVNEPRPELVIKDGSGRSTILLPLVEYHDPVEASLQALGTLQLKNLAPVEKQVNPGRTTIFRFEVDNTKSDPDDVSLEIHGENREWARVVGDPTFRIMQHTSRTFEVAVTVPKEMSQGTYAALVLVAQSQKDPAVSALMRLKADVVQGTDIPDEAPTVMGMQHKSTPDVEAPFLIAGAAVLALALGRRRP